jgi:hypothetical protein
MTVRRAVIFGAPILGYVLAQLHPQHLFLGEDARLFIGVHLVFPVILCLLAGMIVLLVQGVDGAAATAARLLAIPFAVAYTLYTAFDGVALGVYVAKANQLPISQQQTAATLIRSVNSSALAHPLYLTASGLWLAAMLAVVVALWGRVPLPALALVAIGAAAFARSHVRPWGPAGMAAIAVGVVWLELRPKLETDSRPHRK